MLLVLMLSLSLGIGCKDAVTSANEDLLPPQGLQALALDNAVQLTWYPSQLQNVAGYKIWSSGQFNGEYTLLGTTAENQYSDLGVVNGHLYYYAVSTYDGHGRESALSGEAVKAIPRPEGSNVTISDYHSSPTLSGYAFAGNSIGLYSDAFTDVFFENASGRLLLDVWIADTRIQDMGYTSSLDEIVQSPTTGWSATGSLEAISGHTYVVYTADGHYAKLRLTSVSASTATFQWAYQLVAGSPLLKQSGIQGGLPPHDSARRARRGL